jgi:hypothetical protein
MYKLQKDIIDIQNTNPVAVTKEDNSWIPFNVENTNYQQFKKDLANGVALKDTEGTPMTADQIKEFLQGLA